MVDQQKMFSLISSWDHCQRSSPLKISDTLWAGFEPVQNLSSGLVEWSWAATNIKIYILLKKEWVTYDKVSLKQDNYHISMAQLSLQSL